VPSAFIRAARVTDNTWDDMVTVGRVVRPHGIRGQVVVAPETDFASERFRAGAVVNVARDGRTEALNVTAGREHDGRWIVGFEQVASIEAAETLRGLELRIPAADVRAPGPGAYYVHDLVGCRVITMAGDLVGTVGYVRLDAGTALLEVTSKKGEILVPLAEDICRRIDIAGKTIVIDAPEGLIDLNR
jgi:16S rRNA processing protein RimM